MSALFVRPLPFVPASSSTVAAGSKVAFTNLDAPGLTVRLGLTGYVIIDLGAAAVSYDTIAIAGSNLRSSDTIKITTGTTSTGTGGYAGTAQAAFTGFKDDDASTMSIYRIGARTERYIRIDFAAPGHPAGYVSVSRIIAGTAISTDGIEYSAKRTYNDQSVIETGPGYRTVDRYDVWQGWDFRTSWISNDKYRTQFGPLLRWAGSSRNILFVPDDQDSSSWAADAVFGAIVNQAAGEVEGYDAWAVSIKLEAQSK